MLTSKDYVAEHLPRRKAESNKGTYGRVLLLCGSGDMRGAAALATLGALRLGAGLVTLASERCVIDALSAAIYEAIWLDRDTPDLLERSDKMQCIGIGCGMGQTPLTKQLVCDLLSREGAPLVIDADGINVLRGRTYLLKEAKREVILTPHPLEFSRLCGLSVAEIQSDREGVAQAFAKEHGVTLLLKGHHTVITDGTETLINPTGSSALAKGGSGDVLCGMLCALAAQGASPFDAAAIAAYLHGAAGEQLAREYSEYGVLASELPAAAAKLLRTFCK
ncbi:MAG: NAD(P)H-hydrate dehydratase [Clostridia bacterium]|nr:NAD(P)H-hydrate dehydratase [Clostridia bacterium]